MSFKDLPKSLVEAASSVVEQSQKSSDALAREIISEGLSRMGIKDPSKLTEEQEKILYSWSKKQFDLRKELAESSCGCESDMAEDDMPGDSVYHQGGDENAEKKKELDEEDSEELKENLAIEPDDLATNGAVGVTDAASQPVIHADVLKDTSVATGEAEYRLFVQKNTNDLPVIVPPVSLPGAPNVAALREIVEGLPWFCSVCDKALADAESPVQVEEAYVPTAHEKKILAVIKAAVKAQDVYVEDVVSGGVHTHEFIAKLSTGDEVYDTLHITCREEPSKKVPGKMVWVITRDDGDTPFNSVVSEPYVPGIEAKSIAALKAALAKPASQAI